MKNLQKTSSFKALSLLLLLLLTAAIAFSAVGCNDLDMNKNDERENPATNIGGENQVTIEESTAADTSSDGEAQLRGEGETEFVFKVVTAEGDTKNFIVRTDKTTVGEALVDAGLIEGEQGAYGLYVKTVDGETLDYDTDGKYWAFYVDGKYAMSGVDTTEIEAKEYSFRAEK